MGVCTAFVFAALVEFTFVNYMWRSPSISEGKRKNYAERQMMEKRRQIQLARKSNPNNSFFPCLERQDSSIELNMVSNFYNDKSDFRHIQKPLHFSDVIQINCW